MESKIHCPNCGKMLKVVATDPQPIKLTRKTTTETDWFEVKKAIQENPANAFSVGDKISCTLKNGQAVEFTVAAINPYEQNEVAFVLEDLLEDEYPMNEECTNKGGWAESNLRTLLNTKILELIPDELLAVIKPRTIVQNINDAIFNSTDKLWIPSRKELFDADNDVDKGDVHFPLFTTDKSRVKNLNGDYDWYWTRTPISTSSTLFCYVYNGGNPYDSIAASSSGVSFGFLI